MRRVLGLTAALVAGLGFVVPAHAAVITYTLEDVIFDDGGTASGSFDFDTSTNTFSNISIISTAGSLFDGTTHFADWPSTVSDPLVRFVNSDATGSTGLPRLTDAIGISFNVQQSPGVFTSIIPDLGLSDMIVLDYVSESRCVVSNCGIAHGIRASFSGRLVTDDLPVSQVPVPATFLLFLTGLSGLGFTAFRRNQHKESVH